MSSGPCLAVTTGGILNLTARAAVSPAVSAEAWNVSRPQCKGSLAVNQFFSPGRGSFKDLDVIPLFDPNDPARMRRRWT